MQVSEEDHSSALIMTGREEACQAGNLDYGHRAIVHFGPNVGAFAPLIEQSCQAGGFPMRFQILSECINILLRLGGLTQQPLCHVPACMTFIIPLYCLFLRNSTAQIWNFEHPLCRICQPFVSTYLQKSYGREGVLCCHVSPMPNTCTPRIYFAFLQNPSGAT